MGRNTQGVTIFRIAEGEHVVSVAKIDESDEEEIEIDGGTFCVTIAKEAQHGNGTPITLTAQEQGHSVTLTVHNEGPPIPADVLPSVFEPLARGGAEGASHSIGLGLFIARAIVAAHGGHIQVSSSTETGTTFTVALPKAE